MTNIKMVWSDKHNRNAFYDIRGNRLPEICVFDLANVPQRLFCYSVDSIVKVWRWLVENIQYEVSSFSKKIILVSRKDIENEIRAVSDTYQSLESFKTFVIEKAIIELGLKKTESVIPLLLTNKNSKDETDKILRQIRNSYSNFGPAEGKESMFKLYSCDYSIIGSVWNDLQKLGKSFVFVAHSGVPYLLGFYLSTNNQNTFLTEFHLNGDPYEKYRRSKLNSDFIYELNKDSILESPLIIDRSYSGSSLIQLKEKVPNAKSVALFPKTRKAIESCDYFIFNNMLFTKKNVDFSDSNWYINLAIKSLEQK
jgi:hypothetical protein